MSMKMPALRTTDDLLHYLMEYPVEITFSEQPPADVFDRYHASDYVVVSDGISLDRQRLIDHATSARKRVRSVTIEIHEAFVHADHVAARYVLTAEMRKGSRIVTEIHMFGRLAADGRLQRTDQLTRTRDEPAGE